MKKVLLGLAAFLLAASSVQAANRLVVSYGPSPGTPIPGASTIIFTDAFIATGIADLDYIAMQAFLDFGSAGGTTINAFLQTSVDDGLIWQDVCNLQVLAADVTKFCAVNKYVAAAVALTASDGALANDTIRNGIFGTRWRVKLVIVGTYNADNLFRLHIDAQKTR